MTKHSIKLFLDNRKLAIESENMVNPNILQEALRYSDLLSVIRFEFLSVDFLHAVVQFHELATKMAGFEKFYKAGLAYASLKL